MSALLGEMLEGLVAASDASPEEARAVQWHLANLEYGCAASLGNVSLAWWDQDDEHTLTGDHAVVSDGFGRVVEGLAAYSEVLLQREVSLVEHGDWGARVHTKAGGEGLVADAVLVTVPLGVLKAKTVKFAPPLPRWKRSAIERLGFGPIEKVILSFERPFWDEGADFFGCLPPAAETAAEAAKARGEFFMFWNLQRSHGTAALMCVSSGAFAEGTWRHLSYKRVVDSSLAVLGRTFGPQVRQLFRKSVVTDWGRNPFCRGSYSYVGVDASGAEYDELARPVGGRLFFAGEATNGQHPATATGAYLSGLREAQRIDQAGRRGFPPAEP